MKLMLHLTKFGLTAAVSANCQASSWQLASGEIFPIKTKDSGDKLDEVAGQPKQKTQATNLTLTCCKLPTSLPLSRNSAYSWRNVKLSAKISLIGHRRKRPRTSFPNFGKSIFLFLGNRFAFGLSFGLDFWLGPNPTSRSQVSRIALEESETFYFIPLLSLSLFLSLLHSFAWDRQCQPVEQTQRKL